jgi:anthranilate synthase component 1
MNLKQFNQIKHDFNRIPLVREVFADLDTPLSTYLKLADEPYSYLFESVQGGEKWGRYSIIGLACDKRLKVFGHRVILEVDGKVVNEEEIDDPLQYIEDYLNFFRVAEAGLFRLRHDSLYRGQAGRLPQSRQAPDARYPVDAER